MVLISSIVSHTLPNLAGGLSVERLAKRRAVDGKCGRYRLVLHNENSLRVKVVRLWGTIFHKALSRFRVLSVALCFQNAGCQTIFVNISGSQ